MDYQKILDKIEIEQSGQIGKNNAYVIDLKSDSEFGKVYTKLEKASERGILTQLEDNNLLTVHNASLIYLYKDMYQINLRGNFDTNEYSLIVTEFGGNVNDGGEENNN